MDKSIHTAERIKMKSAIKIAFVTLAVMTFWAGGTMGETLNLTYDKAGRLTKIDYPGAGLVEYSRDRAGNLTRILRLDLSVAGISGDVVLDGELNLSDTISSLKIQAGKADETINIYADLNNDGKIDQAEAQHALQWAAGQRTAP
jgi:YD repeat-containing protein